MAEWKPGGFEMLKDRVTVNVPPATRSPREWWQQGYITTGRAIKRSYSSLTTL